MWRRDGSSTLWENQDHVEWGNQDHSDGSVNLRELDAGEALDSASIEELWGVLNLLDSEIALAQENGDVELETKHQKERDLINAHLNAGTDHRGQPRALQSEPKKAGDAVRKAIDTALKNLKPAHFSLWQHLQIYLTYGTDNKYSFENPPGWEF